MLRKRILIFIFLLIGFIGCVKKGVNLYLLRAAREGDNAMVKTLLAEGINVNTKSDLGDTALIMAVVADQPQIVETLLANGADVNRKNIYGMTALAYATIKGSDDIVNVLLENDAEVNEKYERGNTALIIAAKKGYDHTVKLLLEKGANVDVTNDEGQTALMWAARKGYTNIVQTLIDFNADVDIKEDSWGTALNCAEKEGHDKIVKILKQARTRKKTITKLDLEKTPTSKNDKSEYNVPPPTAGDIILGLFSREGMDYKLLNLPYDRTKSGNQILFEIKCGRCHHLDKPLSKFKTFEEWDSTTLRMRAKLPIWISEEERKSITYYLAKVRGVKEPKDIPQNQALFENKCSRCHSIDRPLYALEPLEEWPKIIEQMRNKAPEWITDGEAEVITNYLVENIKARRIELSDKKEISDEQALFELKCSRCHVLDRPIHAKDFSSEDWVNTVMRMREKVPDWISMEEAKKIIEYLIKQ